MGFVLEFLLLVVERIGLYILKYFSLYRQVIVRDQISTPALSKTPHPFLILQPTIFCHISQ